MLYDVINQYHWLPADGVDGWLTIGVVSDWLE